MRHRKVVYHFDDHVQVEVLSLSIEGQAKVLYQGKMSDWKSESSAVLFRGEQAVPRAVGKADTLVQERYRFAVDLSAGS
jgi:hypothetical protein